MMAARPRTLRTLLILRHAKASHDEGYEDRERPLTKKGERMAKRIGELLAEEELIPNLILSSSAVRARQTAEAAAKHAKLKGAIQLLDDLYLAEPEAHVTALARRGGGHERVMVVGHNPGLEALVERITGRSEHLPTGGLADCSLPVESWAELSGQVTGSLIRVWRLKDED